MADKKPASFEASTLEFIDDRQGVPGVAMTTKIGSKKHWIRFVPALQGYLVTHRESGDTFLIHTHRVNYSKPEFPAAEE